MITSFQCNICDKIVQNTYISPFILAFLQGSVVVINWKEWKLHVDGLVELLIVDGLVDLLVADDLVELVLVDDRLALS